MRNFIIRNAKDCAPINFAFAALSQHLARVSATFPRAHKTRIRAGHFQRPRSLTHTHPFKSSFLLPLGVVSKEIVHIPMSGLEIAAGIAGIVSGFITVGRAVKAFQKSRKKKKQWLHSNAEKAENRLVSTIDDGPSRINHEYNHDIRRIGQGFAQGDGNSIFYILFTYSH